VLGGAASPRRRNPRAEAQRMISEKAAALVEAQVAATAATLKHSKKHQVAKKALARLRKAGSSQQAQARKIKGTGTAVTAFSKLA
jgi:hypothetical protein